MAEAEEAKVDKAAEETKEASRGTKRPAEEEAERGAPSLTLAPDAKRQKTDADWGKPCSFMTRQDNDAVLNLLVGVRSADVPLS